MARALAADPPVLLMDEPFSAVDPIVRKGLQEELLRIQEELGKTIVFVTHDIDEAIRLGTMVAVMRTGGRLAQFAPPAELLSSPADSFVEDFLGTDRGIRRLSFFTSEALELKKTPIVAVDSSAEQIASRGGRTFRTCWSPTSRAGRSAGAHPGIWPRGGSRPPTAVLRAALRAGKAIAACRLDCAVLSPTGWAVAVDGRRPGRRGRVAADDR